MIRCEAVQKTYALAGRRVHALRGVDLAIERPGFFAIMGRSGSGKSTLLHLLGALDAPDSGAITIGGTRIDQMNDREATQFRRRGVGIVFQQFNLIPTLTAVENVELPGLLAGDEPRPLRDRAIALLDELGVGDRASHRPEALSGGEQQRVAIARALLFEPPVVLADEPTGNLDTASSEKLWTLLGEVAKRKSMTVVMVTHEPAAAAHCESIFVLRDGVVAGTIDTESLDAGGVAARYQLAVGAGR
ncbi:MAG: ABC transporter ATP-binding protein [Phycisphaerales bacterium]|jgi:putative ABC transport system ATP-binding protein|nr:ABC transporter ATP-binding protein [Phycisphaerales bacterium]